MAEEDKVDVKNEDAIKMLDPTQRKAFDELKEKAKHLTQDDAMLVRFIRARRFDVAAALEQLEKTMKWRAEYNTDHILDQLPPKSDLMRKLIPHNFHKTDSWGRPLYIERTGKIDMPSLMNLVNKDELIANHVFGIEYQMRRARESTEKLGHLVCNTCVIMDLTGLNMGHKKGMDFLKFLTEMDQLYYPETMGKLFIVNAPWLFPVLWKVSRRWLDPHTRSKIFLLGSDYKERLVEHIPPENLPIEYGGTCECEGKGVGCVPQPSADIKPEMYDPPLTEEWIAAGATFKKDIDLKKGYAVTWFYRSIKNDLKFGATFKPQGDEKEVVLVPTQKFNSHDMRIEGSYTATADGTAHFIWDNSYSYFTGKTLKYSLATTDVEGADPAAP